MSLSAVNSVPDVECSLATFRIVIALTLLGQHNQRNASMRPLASNALNSTFLRYLLPFEVKHAESMSVLVLALLNFTPSAPIIVRGVLVGCCLGCQSLV